MADLTADSPRGAVVPRISAPSFRTALAGLVALGVIVRVYYTLRVAPWPPRGFDDQSWYQWEANLLAHGHGFMDPIDVLQGRWVPTAAHPPVYPLVLAGLVKLGVSAAKLRLAGSVFGAGTIAALGLLGRRLAGPRVGLLAAGIAAAYPMLVTADGALLSESLYGSLVALSLLAAYKLLDAPTPANALILGVLLGLAALTRGEAVLLAVLILWPIARRPRGLRAATITCVMMVAIIAPWTVRNWTVFHQPVPISTDFAATIAGSYCPATFYGSNIGSSDVSCIRKYPGNEATALNRARDDAIRYAEHHLGRLPAVVAARLARVWGLRRAVFAHLPQLGGRSPAVLEAGFLVYYVLVALAIFGFVLLRRRGVHVWILTSTFVQVTLVAVLFFGNVNYREQAELSLVVLAAVGADQLWRRVRPIGARINEKLPAAD